PALGLRQANSRSSTPRTDAQASPSSPLKMTSWFKPRGQSISGYEHCAAATRLSYQGTAALGCPGGQGPPRVEASYFSKVVPEAKTAERLRRTAGGGCP